MDPYGSLLSHDDGWCQTDFFDKNEIFGSKRASGQNFRFFAPSYHNVAYKGLKAILFSTDYCGFPVYIDGYCCSFFVLAWWSWNLILSYSYFSGQDTSSFGVRLSFFSISFNMLLVYFTLILTEPWSPNHQMITLCNIRW